MRILIIGGSKFLGRHLSDSAIGRGHDLTVFNRGKISASAGSGVEYIQGDRHKDLGKLAGNMWDAVIDTCGYLPQSLDVSTKTLNNSVGRYVFISSISAYAGFEKLGMDETSSLAELTDEQRARFAEFDLSQDVTAPVLGEAYGPLKAACERVVTRTMGDKALNVRPGLIVGPYDPTDRFTYWVMRVARGGEFVAPGRPERPVQFVDARDLSDWTIRAVENALAGDFNLNGRPGGISMGGALDAIRDTVNEAAAPVWVDEAFIEREEVQPWGELPLFLPESDASYAGFMDVNIDKALDTGLNIRPIDETVKDTFEWRHGESFPMRAGISPEREAELLRKWSEQTT
jgi:2'-hydroxyisoflavone reductase